MKKLFGTVRKVLNKTTGQVSTWSSMHRTVSNLLAWDVGNKIGCEDYAPKRRKKLLAYSIELLGDPAWITGIYSAISRTGRPLPDLCRAVLKKIAPHHPIPIPELRLERMLDEVDLWEADPRNGRPQKRMSPKVSANTPVESDKDLKTQKERIRLLKEEISLRKQLQELSQEVPETKVGEPL